MPSEKKTEQNKIENINSNNGENTVDDLGKLKKNVVISSTQKETEELKTNIESKIDGYQQVLDLLKNKPDGTKTNMYQKLEKLEGVDFNIEAFAKDIDATIKKFLYQSFSESKLDMKMSDRVISSMSVGIQFAMMETLTEVGDKGSDFFSSFSALKIEDSGNILNSLMDVFSSKKGLFNKVGNVNKFYKLANRFQNCVSYISYHSGKGKEFGDGSQINELTNGNKFRKMLDNPVWETSEGLMSKKTSEVGFTSLGGSESKISENDKLELQNIADNVNMPINLKTINSIKSAIPTAQSLLEKRFTYKNNISGLIDKVGSLLNANLLGFGTIGSLLGIKNPIDLFRSKKGEKKGILDFILTGMGFQGGVEGLHREYVKKNIDENLDSKDKKVLISDLYKFYDKEKQSEYKGKNTVDKFGLSKMDEGLKNKIPAQYDILRKTLTEKIKGKEKLINPGVLVKYGQKDCVLSKKFKDINGNEKTRLVIDEDKFDKSKIDEKFMDKYLSDNIKSLASDEKFMSDIENSDQFVLALMGNLVAGSWFIEGVVIGEELVDSYLNDDITTQNDGKIENFESEGDLVFSEKIPENKEDFINKVKTIASNLNINPNWLMLVMDIETGGKFDHKIQNTDSGATGLIQFMPKTAEGLGTTIDQLKTMSNLEQLDYVEKYYKQYQTFYPILKIASYEDLYMVTFYPEALGKDNSYVLGSTIGNAGSVAKQNPAINLDKDLVITKGELSNFIKQKINERVPEEFKRNFA